MTAESSTYTYEGGEQETVTLKRGPGTPHGHALLKISHHDGQIVDCYVNTAWLRDRLGDLGEPHSLTPDAITDEMVGRAIDALVASGDERDTLLGDAMRDALTAALTEPAEDPEVVALAEVLGDFAVADEHTGSRDDMQLARLLHGRGVRVISEEDPR